MKVASILSKYAYKYMIKRHGFTLITLTCKYYVFSLERHFFFSKSLSLSLSLSLSQTVPSHFH